MELVPHLNREKRLCQVTNSRIKAVPTRLLHAASHGFPKGGEPVVAEVPAVCTGVGVVFGVAVVIEWVLNFRLKQVEERCESGRKDSQDWKQFHVRAPFA